MTAIEYRDLSKRFEGSAVNSVDHVNATVAEGEFITILGSSGCGKTTVDPVVVRRRMGYVIQQVGLFPHMTVEENIAVIPGLLKWEKGQIRDRVTDLLTLVGLDPGTFRTRYPAQLSGGQQQRVGLARALATDPKIMLLDEPFGAIDAITRLNLQNELARIHSGTRKTFLLVTHDINEAFKLGSRVMIMNEGKLLQFAPPKEIVRNPADAFVRTLIESARDQEEFWKEVL